VESIVVKKILGGQSYTFSWERGSYVLYLVHPDCQKDSFQLEDVIPGSAEQYVLPAVLQVIEDLWSEKADWLSRNSYDKVIEQMATRVYEDVRLLESTYGIDVPTIMHTFNEKVSDYLVFGID
jgi:hypothetical protein